MFEPDASAKASRTEWLSYVVPAAAVVLIKVVAATEDFTGSLGGAPASSWIERPRLSWPSMHKSHVLQT